MLPVRLRRKPLFLVVILQIVSHLYLSIFIKYHQEGDASDGASKAAIAAIFVHGFGYAIGTLLIL